MMMATQKKEPVAVTAVFWDIKKCPIPPGFDARRVGPCIKRFVEKLGYSGPLTISAIGRLTDVPDEVLRAVSSTGIVLDIVPFGSKSLSLEVFGWAYRNPPPANIMIISDPTNKSLWLDMHMLKYEIGYNILKPYPYGLPQADYYTSAEYLWKSFLLAESGELEENKCTETGESACWVCTICRGDPSGQGFENFTTHLYGEEHAREMLRWLPSTWNSPHECHDYEVDAIEARVDPLVSPPENVSSRWNSPHECHDYEVDAVEARVEAPLVSPPENATTMGRKRKQPKRKCKKLRT